MVAESFAGERAEGSASTPPPAPDFERFLAHLLVVPVVEISREEHAVPLARALVDGGLPCAEITFRTAAAAQAIAAIAESVPDIRVGAGTVLSVSQAEAALAAGASFLVAPGFDPAVVEFALEARRADACPACARRPRSACALARGLSLVKLFPAEAAGGVSYLKALAAPFGDVRFVPTGGIGPDNLAAYLAVSRRSSPAAAAGWSRRQLIADGAFDTIRELAAQARSDRRRVAARRSRTGLREGGP